MCYYRYLAVGGYFKNFHYQFRVGVSTVRDIVLETCDIIWKTLKPIYMSPPNEKKWLEISKDFEKNFNFPNCLGSIDGKHIRMQKPCGAGSEFFNYKNYNSIVLQGVADSYGNFISIDVGDFGRASDGGVFTHSNFGKSFLAGSLDLPLPRQISPNNNFKFPYVFVADEAYPLKKNLMKPFPQRGLSIKKRVFNYRLSRARRLIECAFGMMTKKFRVLENMSLLQPSNLEYIVKACCVLHNTIRKLESKSLIAEVHKYLEEMEESNDELSIEQPYRATWTAFYVRNQYMEYFNSVDGAVSWQNFYT